MEKSAWLTRIWRDFPLKTGQRWLNMLLFAAPLAVVLWILHAPPLYVFFAAALGIVPLAGVLGESTGALAQRTGPSIGGVLNATLGNATELIIAIFAVQAGHIGVVKASLSGSIIGNLLLVLGLSIVAGGTRRGTLRFSRANASMNSTMLMIAVAALVWRSGLPSQSPAGATQPVGERSAHSALSREPAFHVQDASPAGPGDVRTAARCCGDQTGNDFADARDCRHCSAQRDSCFGH